MGSSDSSPIDRILKNAKSSGWTRDGTKYYGPASNDKTGTSKCKTNKPCNKKYWEYDETTGEFTLTDE